MKKERQVWQHFQPYTPKEDIHQRPSAFNIPADLSKGGSSSHSKVLSIANTMKTRMKAAVNNMLWKRINNNRNIPLPQFVSPSLSPSSSSHANVTPFLSNHQLHLSKLKYHALLKQYLAFVQAEVDPSSPITSHVSHPLASSGAALIEYIVHHSFPKQNDSHQHQQEDSFQCQIYLDLPIIPEPEPASASAATTADKSIIRCICDASQEEFGAMVQCDDCTYWLHLECLEMDESSLGESFRCPICYVTLGPGQHITTSGVSWRFAAHLRAKRLATRYKSRSHHGSNKVENRKRQNTYDGSDTDHDYEQRQQKTKRRRFRPDRPSLATNDRLVGYDSFEQHNRSYIIPKMTIDPSITTTMTNSSGNVLFHSTKPHTDTEAMDSDTTESDSEPGELRKLQVPASLSMSSITSSPPLTSSRGGSDTDTPSEASTLDDGHDFLKYETTANGLDQNDIDRSFWLAYLESSLQPIKNPCFATHASDVFLGGDASFPQICHLSSLSSAPESPPSTLCSDQLNEFIFNAGPFWNSIQ